MNSDKRLQHLIASYTNVLADSITNRDFFRYAKALGVLEYLGMPDKEYYNAVAFHMNGEFEKAAELFREVSKQSSMYPSALQNLAIDYTQLGSYVNLNSVLSSDSFNASPIVKLSYRIQCLQHTSYSFIHEHSKELEQIISEDVPAQEYEADDAVTFFEICRAFTVGLVVAGECVNQCSLYQLRTGEKIESPMEIKELERFAEEYERQCRILSLSKHLKIFKYSNSINSLADCALYEESWSRKIAIFQSSNYAQQILQIIYMICNPEIHKNIPACEAVEQIFEAYIRIEPRALAQMVDHYFEIISKAYSDGDSAIAQYLGYVYSEIIATGQDSFSLKERIDILRKSGENDLGASAASIKLTRSMSGKGHDAYVNALEVFENTQNKVHGPRDYSALSLQFFRVLEIEYCEKLINPLVEVVDLDYLRTLVDGSVEEWESTNEEWKSKLWKNDIKYLDKIKTGERGSFEIGAVRTLLGHTIGWKTKNDSCAEYLRPRIEELLTDDGKQALWSKDMLDVISNEVLEKFRVPGAHTGFLSFSKAREAKEYVTENLNRMVTWFK